MNKRTVVLASLCFCILIALCECSRRIEAAAPVDIYADGPITESFDSIFSNTFGQDGPGGVVMVMAGDSLLYERAFGYADLDTREPITDSTTFNLSSTSKFFSAAALLKLQEQGLISLDDSLSKYFPEYPAEFFSKITLRHVLTHSSGIPDLRPRDESEWDNYLKGQSSVFGFSKDYRLYGTEKEHSLVFRNLKAVEFEPGTSFQFTDPGYILIAPIVEKVTGMDFPKWMQENIFIPTGMKGAFYLKPGYNNPYRAHGYTKGDDGKWKEYDYGEVEFFLTRADRGMYCSMNDFRKWLKAFYGGTILSDSSRVAMTMPINPSERANACFGLGTLVVSDPGRPVKICHLRPNGGFTIMEASWPEKDLHFAVFTNRNDWDYKKIMENVDSIFASKEWI